MPQQHVKPLVGNGRARAHYQLVGLLQYIKRQIHRQDNRANQQRCEKHANGYHAGNVPALAHIDYRTQDIGHQERKKQGRKNGQQQIDRAQEDQQQQQCP